MQLTLRSCQWRGSGALCTAVASSHLQRSVLHIPVLWCIFVRGRLKDGKGRDYFFNTITKKSQWVEPDEIVREKKEQAASWAPDSTAKVEIEI